MKKTYLVPKTTCINVSHSGVLLSASSIIIQSGGEGNGNTNDSKSEDWNIWS